MVAGVEKDLFLFLKFPFFLFFVKFWPFFLFYYTKEKKKSSLKQRNIMCTLFCGVLQSIYSNFWQCYFRSEN